MKSRRRLLVATIGVLSLLELAALAWRVRRQPVTEHRGRPERDWLTATGDLSGTRFSPLREITTSNASQLRIVCSYPMGETRSFQANPIVVDGVVFVTTDRVTAAFDGATCRERWRVAHDSVTLAPLWFANRGVAYRDGMLVRGTLDGSMIAIDASTGAVRWSRRISDATRGEVLTMPPLIVGDRVLIGPAGNENAVAGWVGAFSLQDGTELWRFRTLVDTLAPNGERLGGGAVWTPMSFDTVSGTLYVATGNPAPDYAEAVRPAGEEWYTNSVLALDIATGALRWHRQLVSRDVHDWDLTQASPIVGPRVIAAGKDGIVRALERDSGRVVWSTSVSEQRNVAAPITHQGTDVCPGTYGGVVYNGPAYSALTGLLYVPSVEYCGRFTLAREPFERTNVLLLGGTFSADPESFGGRLTALDAVTGRVRWVYHANAPMLAAVTVTAGGVVLTGELGGDFVALNAETGAVLRRIPTGGAMGGGVVTYRAHNTQFIAALSGAATNFLPVPISRAARVIVFAIPR